MSMELCINQWQWTIVVDKKENVCINTQNLKNYHGSCIIGGIITTRADKDVYGCGCAPTCGNSCVKFHREVSSSCVKLLSDTCVIEWLLRHFELIERGDQFRGIIRLRVPVTVSGCQSPPPCRLSYHFCPNKINGWNSSVSWLPWIVCLPCTQLESQGCFCFVNATGSAGHLLNWKVIAPRVNALQIIATCPLHKNGAGSMRNIFCRIYNLWSLNVFSLYLSEVLN